MDQACFIQTIRISLALRNSLIVITGPTASGKTDLAIQVAQKLGTEIISADSRQVYKGLEIGSAYPTTKQLEAVKHHFIGELELDNFFSAGEFAIQARIRLSELFKTKERVVVVGGSGLYIKALIEGMDDLPLVPVGVREALNRDLNEVGIAALLEELRKVDPDYFEKVDRHNPQRIIRALEIFRATGRPLSSFRQGKKTPQVPYQLVALDWSRDDLYSRINERTDQMMANGFLEEVARLNKYRHHNALNTVGYKELFMHMDNQMDLEVAVGNIKQHTRNFAKRQLTYLRHQLEPIWIKGGEKAFATIESML